MPALLGGDCQRLHLLDLQAKLPGFPISSLRRDSVVKTKKRNRKKERTQTDWEEEVDWRR